MANGWPSIVSAYIMEMTSCFYDDLNADNFIIQQVSNAYARLANTVFISARPALSGCSSLQLYFHQFRLQLIVASSPFTTPAQFFSLLALLSSNQIFF